MNSTPTNTAVELPELDNDLMILIDELLEDVEKYSSNTEQLPKEKKYKKDNKKVKKMKKEISDLLIFK